MVDCIVSRHDLKERIATFLQFLTHNEREFNFDGSVDSKAMKHLPQKLKALLALSSQELTHAK